MELPEFTTGTKNERAFKTLISLILMSMTMGKPLARATQNIMDYGCTPEKLANIPVEELTEKINMVSFYNRKVDYIKRTSKMVIEKHDGIVPDNFEEIREFPGIGTISSLMMCQYTFGKIDGIAVDSHILRVSNLLGWANAKGAERTRKQLESWLPKSKWGEIYPLLLGYGQSICKPK